MGTVTRHTSSHKAAGASLREGKEEGRSPCLQEGAAGFEAPEAPEAPGRPEPGALALPLPHSETYSALLSARPLFSHL